MRKILSFVFFIQFSVTFAKTAQGFVYESTVRNSNNQLVINQYVKHKFSIRLNSTSGSVIYSETQNPHTDSSGNISVIIGTGTAATGNFSQINWLQGIYYMEIQYFSGNTCQWIDVPMVSGGQVVSNCNGIYIWDNCPETFANLVWSDEFNGNGVVNSNNWYHQTQFINGNSWSNGELQHYTNRQINSFENNGSLNIVAKKEAYNDQGETKQFTSARLNSKFSFKYGRVEVRAKLPSGAGTWPAIWMLGKNIIEPGGFWSATHGTAPWPACGEIDIMEHWGTNQNFVQSAMHTPSSHGGTVNLGGQTVPTASTQFHIYELEWTAEKMIFSVDGIPHYTYNPAVKNASTWPFDAEQYILLNLAIQSSINPDFTDCKFEVDYVRVYQ